MGRAVAENGGAGSVLLAEGRDAGSMAKMERRGSALALLLGVMLPAAAAAQGTAVPAVLAPYVADGAFDPGDFGWMAGRFAAGGTAARAAWESTGTYQKACLTAAHAQAKAETAAQAAEPPALPPARKRVVVGKQGSVSASPGRARTI